MRRLALLLVLLAQPVAAANLYVNNSGSPACSDSTAKASNSAASPWCTIGRATWGNADRATPSSSEAAAAGDTVYITPGTYNTASAWDGAANRYTIYYNPTNSGSAGNPITFRSTTGTFASIVLTNSGTGGTSTDIEGGPLIGGNTVDYILWMDFDIDETVAETQDHNASMVLFYGCDWCGLFNSRLTANNTEEAEQVGDNWSGVRFHESAGGFIRNNEISYFGATRGDENNAGILSYMVSGTIYVEGNYLHHNGSGIYQKGNNSPAPGIPTVGGWRVRYNHFKANSFAQIYTLLIPSLTTDPNLIAQNVFDGSGSEGVLGRSTYGIKIRAHDNYIADATFALVINNTFYTHAYCVFFSGDFAQVSQGDPYDAGIAWRNNLCHSVNSRVYQVDTVGDLVDGVIDVEHNGFYNYGASLADITGVGGSISLATWQGTYTRDDNSPSALTSDPLLAAAGSGDFRLCTASNTPVAGCSGASPALTHGRGARSVGGAADNATIPAGAYITNTETIGRGAVPNTTATDDVGASTPRYRFRFRVSADSLREMREAA